VIEESWSRKVFQASTPRPSVFRWSGLAISGRRLQPNGRREIVLWLTIVAAGNAALRLARFKALAGFLLLVRGRPARPGG
jgi:hypothetical protein